MPRSELWVFVFSRRYSANGVTRWAKGGAFVGESEMTELFGGLHWRRERLGWRREEGEGGGMPAKRSWLGRLDGCSCGAPVFFHWGVGSLAVALCTILRSQKTTRNGTPIMDNNDTAILEHTMPPSSRRCSPGVLPKYREHGALR